MAEHTNETIATLRTEHPIGDEFHIAVFTGDESSLERMPVCLEFPDNEPCLSIDAARALAEMLTLAADVAAKAQP